MSKFKLGDVVRKIDDSLGYPLVVLFNEGIDTKVFNISSEETLCPYTYDLKLVPNAKPWKSVKAQVDGYTAVVLRKGKKFIFTMGCKTFTSVKGFRRHWDKKGSDFYWDDFGSDASWKSRLKSNKKRLAGMEKLYAKIKEM